jgi:hypothetical protein
MKTVTLELPDEAASLLERGGVELRRAVENAVNTILEQERAQRRQALITLMHELQHEAEANGLTDDILLEILHNEE